MAYQSKKHRKFVATSVTAALVATAVAPAAGFAAEYKDQIPAWAKEAVDYVSEKGIMKGTGEGYFKPGDNITRAEVAQMLVNAFGWEIDEDAKVTFPDVAEGKWYYSAIATLQANAPELLKGNEKGQFLPEDNIDRQSMARLIADAFGIKASGTPTSFSDVPANHWAKAAIDALSSNGVVSGKGAGKFDLTGKVTRAEAAQFFFKADTLEASVVSVSAINERTLELTGTGLSNLKAEDITLAGNVVKSISGNKVTFENGFPLDTEQTVKINGEEFKFTYSFSVSSVSLTETTFDDDTAGQVVKFSINGLTTNADPEYLRQAGYTVNFVAKTTGNAAANGFFATGAATNQSSTGLLADEIAPGEYVLEVQILKDGKVVVSDTKTISVVDMESLATAISDVELTNVNGFVHNSTTLVTGETATITEILGNAAGKKDVELPLALAEVSSSNPEVISVDSATRTLSANVAGNATITVKIGSVTKTINMTVSNAARTVAKVTPSETNVKLVQGVTRNIQVTTTDQYGDPISVAAADITEDIPEDAANTALVTVNGGAAGELVTGANGRTATGFAITASATTTGTGAILFKDGTKVLGQLSVTVSNLDNVNLAAQKVEYAYNSTKNNSFNVGETRTYQVSNFNTVGAYNGSVNSVTVATDANTDGVVDTGFFPQATPAPGTQDLFVHSTKPSVATVSVATNALGVDEITVTGAGKGTADIVIYDHAGAVKHRFTVTVDNPTTIITKVNFKSVAAIDYAGKTINVTDVLDVRPDTIAGVPVDPIVYGIEHNASTVSKVRLDQTNTAELLIYIDDNNDGRYQAADDTLLGAITAEVLTGATGTTLNPLIGNLADISSTGGTYTTAATDKGSILFRVLVDGPDANTTFETYEAIATRMLSVNVK